jgi:lipoprotein signal peptidase
LEFFILIGLLILAGFSFHYIRNHKGSRVGDTGFILIVLGGLYNLYSWVKYGCVKDYLNFFSLFHFNLADLMVTIGVFFVLIAIWKKK